MKLHTFRSPENLRGALALNKVTFKVEMCLSSSITVITSFSDLFIKSLLKYLIYIGSKFVDLTKVNLYICLLILLK